MNQQADTRQLQLDPGLANTIVISGFGKSGVEDSHRLMAVGDKYLLLAISL